MYNAYDPLEMWNVCFITQKDKVILNNPTTMEQGNGEQNTKHINTFLVKIKITKKNVITVILKIVKINYFNEVKFLG